jgi:hypothetical protein
MVTSKPTTEASGASSPVTNTFPDCADCDVEVEVDEFDDDPQLAAIKLSPNISTIPRVFFIANLLSESL